MSDSTGSARTQEIPRVAVDPVTQEIPAVNAVPPTYVPLPQSPPTNRFLYFFYWLRHGPAWIAPLALFTCFAVAAAGVLATDPTDNTGPSTCAFRLVTGFDCPGCGGTRAFYYVLTANLPEAAQHHAIAVFAAPFLAWLYLSWTLRRVFPSLRERVSQFRVTPAMASYFLVVWGGFWVIRNLPWEPFTNLYV